MRRSLLMTVIVSLVSVSSWAYGPLLVADDGTPIRWDGGSPTLTIVAEDGDCGDHSGEEMVDLITDLFGQFTDVAESTLTLEVVDDPLINKSGQEVTSDINASNYESVTGLNDDELSEVLLEAGQNPMIWDDNCAIIADFLGPSNCATVLGFSVPYVDTTNNELVRSEEVINCPRNSDDNTLESTLIHEMGHGLGCDHTQANQAEAEDSDGSNNTLVPLMFPTSIEGDDPTSLQEDDELCLATLYPEDSLTANFWTLEGNLRDEDGNGIPCANMVLENTSDASDVEVTFVTATAATFSDDNGDDSLTADECEDDCGTFTFKGLSVNTNYRLSVEPVDASFTGGSSVGRCEDETNTDVPTATFSETFSVSAVSTETATITCNDSSCASPAISRTNTAGGGGGTDDDSSSSGSCSLSTYTD